MKTNVETLRNRFIEITKDLEGFKAILEDIKQFDSIGDILGGIARLNDLVLSTVVAIQISAEDMMDDIEDLKSEDKLEAAVIMLDDAMKFPFYLEMVDGPMIRIILSLGVDTLNKKYGKDWNLDAMRTKLAKGVSVLEDFVEDDEVTE